MKRWARTLPRRMPLSYSSWLVGPISIRLMVTLQQQILDLINELNYLDLVTPPPQDVPIKKQVDDLIKVSRHQLALTLKEDDAAFVEAARAIKNARDGIKAAAADLAKINTAIKASADALRLIERAVGFAAPLF